MLSATELRIGNYIDYTTEREIVTMQTTYEYIRLIHNGNKNFKPIPLTEEWLLKFGFKHLGNGKFSGGFKNMFKISSHQFGIDFYYGAIDPYYIKPHYVHNLQNLYFALTNQELTLTK
jgi:hypothetical protein